MPDLTPERWREVSALLDQLLEVEPAERESWLEREIVDPELRAEVAALAARADRTSGVLDGAAGDHLGTLLREEGFLGESAGRLAGERIGPYQIAHEVGRGGMGVVFLAERVDGQFEQRVALKLIKRGLDTDEILGRFQRERQILAHLEHPSIARLLDGGVSEDGQPYFAMEYVEGEPITVYCDRRRLPIDDRLRLFDSVCDAVQYAHRNLIVHRDLKPSNILVTEKGELKLVDFGIAKLLGEDPAATLVTRAGARPLTPAYASPEQLRGEPVTTATDVYALGVVLYELLSGRRPYGAAATSVPELERAVLETDAAPPSAVVAATPRGATAAGDEPPAEEISAARQSTPAALARRLTGDLDAIVLTALRKEPERRYSSASVLRQDLARHLDHQPILARPDGALYRMGKFVRRHRVGVPVTALLALSITAGYGSTVWQARKRALEAEKARQVTEFVTGLFEAADPAQAQGQEITARELVEQGATRLDRELEGQPELQAEMDLVLGRIIDKLGQSEEALELLDRSLERLPHTGRPAWRKTRADALRAKGAALVRLGRAEEAEPLLLEAAAEHRKLPTRGFDREIEVAEDLDELSIALHALGRLEESGAAVRQAFELRLPVLGPDHPGIASSYNNLAVTQRQLGEFSEAEANYKKALEIRIPALGREHPETADTLNNLAALLLNRGRYPEAAAAFEEVAGIYARLYGEKHQRTVTGANNLAVSLLKTGDLDRAEKLFETVLTYWRETASDRHPNALVTQSNLGLLYQMRGETRRARTVADSVVEGATSVLGADHPVTAVLSMRLASASRELGQYARAKEIAEPLLGRLEKSYGGEHQHVAAALEELGRIESELGDLEQAEDHLRRAVAMRVGQGGEQAFETLAARAALASVVRDRGDLGESERLLTADLGVGRGVLPANHPVLIDLLLELGQTLGIAEAEPLLAEAVALAAERYGSFNWHTAEAELLLGLCLKEQGDEEEARALLAGSLETLGSQLGEGHRLTRRAAAALESR